MSSIPPDVRAKLEAAMERGFVEFMNGPATKMIISLIPAGNEVEALPSLLRSCFQMGFNAGQVALGIEMLEHVIRERKK